MPDIPHTPMFRAADAQHAAQVMVIAEIGVNHDGHPSQAEALIHAAVAAGADAVKFQLFQPDRLLSKDALLATYQDGQADDARTLLDKLTLPMETMRTLREVAQQAGVKFLITPFSLADVRDVEALHVDAVKIASPDAVNTPLIDAAAALGKPMLISTGTCELDELDHAAAAAKRTGGALLQCVSAYPTPDADAALGGIAALRQRFDALAVGYSDHTAAQDTGALAVAAGAVVLEKHLTHNRSAPGPDHAASLEPDALKRYTAAARRAAAMLGPIRKTCLPLEQNVHRVARQSLCLTRDLPAGHRLTPSDLTLKRPGTGLPANQLSQVLGQPLAHPVPANRPLQPNDLLQS